jgi:hypothetical protein
MWYHVDLYEPSQANAAHLYRVVPIIASGSGGSGRFQNIDKTFLIRKTKSKYCVEIWPGHRYL